MNALIRWRVWALAAVGVVAMAGSAAPAEEGPGGAPEAQVATPQSAVAQALSQVRRMNAEVNLGAEYFIYVQSASWCGPCNREMPDLVKCYPEMKAANVELILVGRDETWEEAEAFLKRYGAAFPGVHYKDEALLKLPGFELSRGVPQATVVHKSGRVVLDNHGSYAFKWRRIVEDDQQD